MQRLKSYKQRYETDFLPCLADYTSIDTDDSSDTATAHDLLDALDDAGEPE